MKNKIALLIIASLFLIILNYSVYKISTEGNKKLLSPQTNFIPVTTREIATLPLLFFITFLISVVILCILIYFLLIKQK